MTGLEPLADQIVREAVDAYLDGHYTEEREGELVFETRNSRYRLMDGVLFSAPDSSLIGAELVGWLVDGRRPVVESEWQPSSRAVLVDRKRGRHIIVTSGTRMPQMEGVSHGSGLIQAGSGAPPPSVPPPSASHEIAPPPMVAPPAMVAPRAARLPESSASSYTPTAPSQASHTPAGAYTRSGSSLPPPPVTSIPRPPPIPSRPPAEGSGTRRTPLHMPPRPLTAGPTSSLPTPTPPPPRAIGYASPVPLPYPAPPPRHPMARTGTLPMVPPPGGYTLPPVQAPPVRATGSSPPAAQPAAQQAAEEEAEDLEVTEPQDRPVPLVRPARPAVSTQRTLVSTQPIAQGRQMQRGALLR